MFAMSSNIDNWVSSCLSPRQSGPLRKKEYCGGFLSGLLTCWLLVGFVLLSSVWIASRWYTMPSQEEFWDSFREEVRLDVSGNCAPRNYRIFRPVTSTPESRKIAIASLLYTHEKGALESYIETSLPNWVAYSELHGYDFAFRQERYRCLPYSVDIRSAKLLFVLELLMRGYEAVFWTDSDALVTNCTITLQSFLGEGIGKTEGGTVGEGAGQPDFFFTGDMNWPINSGQWIVRSTDWGQNFLRSVFNLILWRDTPGWTCPRTYHSCEFDPHDNGAFVVRIFGRNLTAMDEWRSKREGYMEGEHECGEGCVEWSKRFFESEFRGRSRMLPIRAMGSPRCDRPSDFRVHFPGEQKRKKLKISECLKLLPDQCQLGRDVTIAELWREAEHKAKTVWHC
uniref:Nucleotide-diphospho-sugar transferase domain-containing protein n=1 Tax=Chromera velia CCMP2878 TaxID=1169474 RepID=A0A0G4GXH7_9ALVE|eukprot:Cvel_23779.t1-p1 / transcript=Cvel_23779.t1 / gene=Cvel_23779 / organism=Chromera_velia_CCMP2878 / gene_product=hypothetical protein / transcript_product=hypothetical protein / location=Cvel_scaffold2495:10137-11321(-) / protein_length=395 / sequence_SO=supercontig / SO=protein_coding / is_pseudo=false